MKKGEGCWEWQGSRNRKGYGRIQVGGVVELAHRVSYEMEVGPIPSRRCVLHRCDNPSCVRPDHLYVGTIADNARDMVERGRAPDNRGERSGKAKLSNAKVAEIKLLRAAGARCVDLAEQFGVHPAHISRVCNGLRWKT